MERLPSAAVASPDSAQLEQHDTYLGRSPALRRAVTSDRRDLKTAAATASSFYRPHDIRNRNDSGEPVQNAGQSRLRKTAAAHRFVAMAPGIWIGNEDANPAAPPWFRPQLR